MSQSVTITLYSVTQAWQELCRVWRDLLKPKFTYAAIEGANLRYVLTIKPETRSTAQNARMWAMLTDVSEQVQWYGKRLTTEDWKHVFTAGLRKLDVVPNLDGTGFVALGMSTSNMTVSEMSDLMELMQAFGAERGVVFKETA